MKRLFTSNDTSLYPFSIVSLRILFIKSAVFRMVFSGLLSGVNKAVKYFSVS